jgi:hypothetical protein
MDDDSFNDENAFVNTVCDTMDPGDMLLSLVMECPYDARKKSCPIKEMEEWRKMGLKDARDTIKSLPHNVKKELVEKHRCCSCALSVKKTKKDI